MDTQALDLIDKQCQEWDLAKKNYGALSSVISREILFDGFKLNIQFNPERVRSSAAKVDAQSIAQRKCFLCTENLFKEQRWIDFNEHYQLLINPYPIFNKHLTIPCKVHTKQLITGRVLSMLELAKSLSSFVIFYNGPKCGASAPDHFHFQAGNKGQLPIEKDLTEYNNRSEIFKSAHGEIYTLENYLRKALVYSSKDIYWMNEQFNLIYDLFAKMQVLEEEPMMNILATYDLSTQVYTLIVFPRQKHRPKQFFEEGEKQIIFSPASVDFGGLLITVREEDFNKLTAETVKDMMEQVSLSDSDWGYLKNILKEIN